METVKKAKGGGWAPYNSDNPFLEWYGTEAEKLDGPAGDTAILATSTDPHEVFQVLQHEWYRKLSKSMKYVCVCVILFYI